MLLQCLGDISSWYVDLGFFGFFRTFLEVPRLIIPDYKIQNNFKHSQLRCRQIRITGLNHLNDLRIPFLRINFHQRISSRELLVCAIDSNIDNYQISTRLASSSLKSTVTCPRFFSLSTRISSAYAHTTSFYNTLDWVALEFGIKLIFNKKNNRYIILVEKHEVSVGTF